MISNIVQIGDAEIKIEHKECYNAFGMKSNNLFVESESSDKNTLSTITFNDYLDIYIFWDSFPSAEKIDILYLPETQVLFVGCGSLSFRVSTSEEEIIGFNNLCLFWGFSRINDFILETGELDCFLYSLEGELISSAPVDPPYEMEITDKGIKFESIVHGETWLKFKDN